MELLWIILGILAGLALVILPTTYICYRMAFYSAPRKPTCSDAIDFPEGEIYEPFKLSMEKWAKQVRAMPHENVEITSFDGLKLRGKYYEYEPGAPIELMFHGYRGSGERDLNGGVQRCFKLGRSALIVEQRASGVSEGNVITFGVNEQKDCLTWLAFMETRFGSDARIILTGISMGASTVLMAAGRKLPKTVIGVLADCGYSSQKEIIKKVIRQLKLPADMLYPFVKLGARIFGKFNLEEVTPLEAVKRATVPIIFFHGENDDFVPCQMSRELYEACTSRKKLVTVPEAGHGLSYPVQPQAYLSALREFFGPEASS